MTSVMATTRL